MVVMTYFLNDVVSGPSWKTGINRRSPSSGLEDASANRPLGSSCEFCPHSLSLQLCGHMMHITSSTKPFALKSECGNLITNTLGRSESPVEQDPCYNNSM